MLRTITTAIALTLAVTAANAAPATLHFADLDISKPGDARILAGRVQVAAQAACADRKPEAGQKASQFYGAIFEHCVSSVSHRMNIQVQAASVAHPVLLAGN